MSIQIDSITLRSPKTDEIYTHDTGAIIHRGVAHNAHAVDHWPGAIAYDWVFENIPRTDVVLFQAWLADYVGADVTITDSLGNSYAGFVANDAIEFVEAWTSPDDEDCDRFDFSVRLIIVEEVDLILLGSGDHLLLETGAFIEVE